MELFHEVEFWIAIPFLIAAVILFKKAAPQVTEQLDARARGIAQELEDAQRLREEAEQTLAEYQRKQRDALAEAQEIVTRAKADAEQAAAQAALDLDAAIKRREAQARDNIAQIESKALTEVRNLAVDVAIEATRVLLAETMDQQRGAALIDAAVAELPQRLH